MTAGAYLVVWRDQGGRGRVVDAGIYSEESPTTLLRSDRRSECVLSVQSRYLPGDGGFERARTRLLEIIARSPELRWVHGMRTFRWMQWSEARMRQPLRGRLAA